MVQFKRYSRIEAEQPPFLMGVKMISETCWVCYDKLWALLTERKMKKKDLQSITHLSSAVIAKLGKGLPVHLNTLLKICSVLHCTLDDIVDIHATLSLGA